eukprot:2726293-Pleurochrysis_carterae.AAC.2
MATTMPYPGVLLASTEHIFISHANSNQKYHSSSQTSPQPDPGISEVNTEATRSMAPALCVRMERY